MSRGDISGLTKEQKRAIAALKKVAKDWPDGLWLFSGSGTLWVMRYGEDGERIMSPDFIVCEIDIPNDGGDW